MLTENEWNTINNMLLELYTIDELDVFTSKILKMIRMLIPYTKGWFIILDDDRKIFYRFWQWRKRQIHRRFLQWGLYSIFIRLYFGNECLQGYKYSWKWCSWKNGFLNKIFKARGHYIRVRYHSDKKFKNYRNVQSFQKWKERWL